ncbi:hypothetical protein HU200_027192 [Digitaria exilis]|uniref:Myb/SANT-like DNA-binding domain-containing protein n=1 Tax=Digitaria exilis TaxID=1010633 RepID=A0A835EWR4_9POAL|nr:hypothetical protein HU200_027192 [Digitaria exilis]
MHPSTNGPQVFHLPENTNASTQPDEEDVEEEPVSPAPTGKDKRTKVVSRIKLSNFNPEEDVNLVKTWLEIRCDPITSTGLKKEKMWLRILQRYNLRRGSYPERSVKSLQCRWHIIKTEVGKFSSFYADVIRENPSGMSDADKTTHAAAKFAAILKQNFAYLHCWEIMKDVEPKWQDTKSRAFAKLPGADGFGEDTINLGDNNSSPTGSAEKRPMGRDEAKAAKKKANSSAGSASSSEYAVTMMHPSTNGLQVFHLPENTNASTQPDEEDVEEEPVSPAPTGKDKRTKVVSRIKLSNFNPEEDVNLVKTWLEIRCDPIASTGLKKESMWLRILQRYNMRRGSYPERSVKSLQSRWDTIKAEVGKFSSFYADVIRENPSRMSDADKVCDLLTFMSAFCTQVTFAEFTSSQLQLFPAECYLC